ncbi:expressed unknown protein [Seminavis robusta]|uniref:Uncharacterized protein n=1 Tax=Seminavis robusta TaxID=568900 RepID=A0A9N8EIZ8_9STRA|nr:expressed unknown protein [Seminavis robusta]|eukprot:Sro1178_g249510.1 n/a (211) ;mRNA; f:20637-21269
MCPLAMISNQFNCHTNTYPLAMISNMLSSNDYSFAAPIQSRKRLSFSSYRPACEGPASKKRRRVVTPTPVVPAKKSVRFAEENNTFAFKMVNVEDLQNAWYQAREIASFKQDSKNTVYAFYRANGDYSKLPKEHCIRGLEHVVTPTAAMAQKKSRKERVTAVLYQQQLQRDTATSNPELLKLVSSLFSQQKSEDAVRMAAADSTIWTAQF